jgi:hypothetical protein
MKEVCPPATQTRESINYEDLGPTDPETSR